jgi:hypothetical protein
MRLKERLAGSEDWEEFKGTWLMRPLLATMAISRTMNRTWRAAPRGRPAVLRPGQGHMGNLVLDARTPAL